MISRKRKGFLVLLLVIFLGFGTVRAQTSLSVSWADSLTSSPIPSTQVFNDTIRYTFHVANLSTTPFVDSLDFQLRTTLGTFLLTTIQGLNIPAQTDTIISFLDSTLATRYSGGINVVVVWPTLPGLVFTDTLRGSLFVGELAADDPSRVLSRIDAYPTPSRDELHFTIRDPRAKVVKTVMTNSFGEVIRSYDHLPETVVMNGLASGLYFVTVTESSGQRTTLKIMKQ